MKKFFLSPTLFFIFLFPLCTRAQQLPDSTIAQLKIGADGFMKRFHSPAFVLVIVHDKEIIFNESLGFTDLEKKTPATMHSKFPILSVTKTFTATMLMQLKEKRQVSLDDDVAKYIPECKNGNNANGIAGTTLLQLATHTSGLPRNSPADFQFMKNVDRWVLGGKPFTTLESASNKEFLASLPFIKRQYRRYDFMRSGDRHYSNMGYSLLGIALERAAKTRYDHYVINNILKPLQMTSSGFMTETVDHDTLAKGYFYDDIADKFIETPVFKPNSALYAGGMFSSASDLAKFISFQFAGSGNGKILSEENKAMMHAFNIGWKPSYPFVTHEGAMLGHRCEIVFNPAAKVGWVILANTTDFDFSRINEYISRLVMPLFPVKPVTDLKKFAGTYQLDGGYGSLKLYLENDSLYSDFLQGELRKTPLIPAGNNNFVGQKRGGYSISYEFTADEKGNITSFNMGQFVWRKVD